MTYMPENPECKVCRTSKAQRKQKRRKKAKAQVLLDSDVAEEVAPTKFGQKQTGDTLINTRSKDAEVDEYPEARVGLVMLDVGAAWIDVFRKVQKPTGDTKQAMNEWKGAD